MHRRRSPLASAFSHRLVILLCSIWAIQDHKDPLRQTPNLTRCRTKAWYARSSSTTHDPSPQKKSQYHSSRLCRWPNWPNLVYHRGYKVHIVSTSPKILALLRLTIMRSWNTARTATVTGDFSNWISCIWSLRLKKGRRLLSPENHLILFGR